MFRHLAACYILLPFQCSDVGTCHFLLPRAPQTLGAAPRGCCARANSCPQSDRWNEQETVRKQWKLMKTMCEKQNMSKPKQNHTYVTVCNCVSMIEIIIQKGSEPVLSSKKNSTNLVSGLLSLQTDLQTVTRWRPERLVRRTSWMLVCAGPCRSVRPGPFARRFETGSFHLMTSCDRILRKNQRTIWRR